MLTLMVLSTAPTLRWCNLSPEPALPRLPDGMPMNLLGPGGIPTGSVVDSRGLGRTFGPILAVFQNILRQVPSTDGRLSESEITSEEAEAQQRRMFALDGGAEKPCGHQFQQ